MALTQSAKKRADILRAALEEFAALGYDAASVDAITARAGVSKRTVYNHFSSKEELFETVRVELLSQALHGVGARYEPDVPVREQLLGLAHQMLRVRTSPSFLAGTRLLLGAAYPNQNSELARESFAQALAHGGGAAGWLREAEAAGAIDLDGTPPEEASLQLAALLDAFACWPQVLGGLPPPGAAEQERLARNAVDLLLARYGGAGKNR